MWSNSWYSVRVERTYSVVSSFFFECFEAKLPNMFGTFGRSLQERSVSSIRRDVLLTKSLTLISLLQSPSIKVLFNSIIFILLVGNGCYPNKDCKITIFFPHSIAWIVSFYVVRHKITIVRYGSYQLRLFFCAYYLHSFTHLLVNGRLIAELISFAD